jgi:hypothetical protein
MVIYCLFLIIIVHPEEIRASYSARSLRHRTQSPEVIHSNSCGHWPLHKMNITPNNLLFVDWPTCKFFCKFITVLNFYFWHQVFYKIIMTPLSTRWVYACTSMNQSRVHFLMPFSSFFTVLHVRSIVEGFPKIEDPPLRWHWWKIKGSLGVLVAHDHHAGQSGNATKL